MLPILLIDTLLGSVIVNGTYQKKIQGITSEQSSNQKTWPESQTNGQNEEGSLKTTEISRREEDASLGLFK